MLTNTPVWFRNRLISAALELVLSRTEKIMYSIVSQTIFHEYQNKSHKINTSFVSPVLQPIGVNNAKITIKVLSYDVFLVKAQPRQLAKSVNTY